MYLFYYYFKLMRETKDKKIEVVAVIVIRTFIYVVAEMVYMSSMSAPL